MDKNTYVMGWWKNAFRIENAKIAYSYALPELKDEDLIYCQLNRKYKYSNSLFNRLSEFRANFVDIWNF